MTTDPSDGAKRPDDPSGSTRPSTEPTGSPSRGPRTTRITRSEGSTTGARRRPQIPDGAASAGEQDDTPPFGRRRHHRVAVGTVAVLVVAALIAALFVLPVRAWLGQRDALAESEEQLDVIWAENKRLEKLYDDLQTDARIEQQAREQFGLVMPGEQAVTMLPAPPATALPTGWPYDQVQGILALRAASGALGAAP